MGKSESPFCGAAGVERVINWEKQTSPVTSVHVFAVAGHVSGSVALVTVELAIAGAAAAASPAATAENRAAPRFHLVALPGEVSGSVTPVARNYFAVHD